MLSLCIDFRLEEYTETTDDNCIYDTKKHPDLNYGYLYDSPMNSRR